MFEEGAMGCWQVERAPGRPRSLTPHQEKQVFRWINGRDPRQYGLDFGLAVLRAERNDLGADLFA